jgi:hypothetical protein
VATNSMGQLNSLCRSPRKHTRDQAYKIKWSMIIVDTWTTNFSDMPNLSPKHISLHLTIHTTVWSFASSACSSYCAPRNTICRSRNHENQTVCPMMVPWHDHPSLAIPSDRSSKCTYLLLQGVYPVWRISNDPNPAIICKPPWDGISPTSSQFMNHRMIELIFILYNHF